MNLGDRLRDTQPKSGVDIQYEIVDHVIEALFEIVEPKAISMAKQGKNELMTKIDFSFIEDMYDNKDMYKYEYESEYSRKLFSENKKGTPLFIKFEKKFIEMLMVYCKENKIEVEKVVLSPRINNHSLWDLTIDIHIKW